MPKSPALSALARCFAGGEPGVDQIVARSSQALGRPWRWLRSLAQRYAAAVAGRTRPRYHDVVHFLRHDAGFQNAWSKYGDRISVEHWLTGPQVMQPVAAAASWAIPAIETAGMLSEWLMAGHTEVQWFADLKGLGYKKRGTRLRHYHYRALTKQFGSIRLIEAPKPRLKAMQRQILERILDFVPAHPAVHGFVKGRSIESFAAPHVGRRVVLKMDLQDFFPSFAGSRVQSFFRTAGYPEPVADLLGGICTNAAPRDVWGHATGEAELRQLGEARALYARPHLPQGAPTSPAIANLCFYRIDCRLAALAAAAGARYTRYADDLAFSGDEDFERRAARFSIHVAAILLEEGFSVHHRKTRIMRQGVRQHLAGLVVNQRINVRRSDFDRLKATLTNCIRHGPETQNREAHPRFRAHLEGRVAFVEAVNPGKGRRLRSLLQQIQWP
jgi:hypothetical protein